MMGARAALRRFAEGEPMAGFAFLSENVSILAWILSLRFYIVAFKLLRITIVPEGLLANSLIAAWGCWRFFRYFFQHCKGALCLTFPRASKKRVAWCPSEPYRHALPGALLKEDEMQAALRIGKCSMQCAVGYRIRICFEYQSVPLLE